MNPALFLALHSTSDSLRASQYEIDNVVHGRKRMFLLGAAIFMIGSAACGTADASVAVTDPGRIPPE